MHTRDIAADVYSHDIARVENFPNLNYTQIISPVTHVVFSVSLQEQIKTFYLLTRGKKRESENLTIAFLKDFFCILYIYALHRLSNIQSRKFELTLVDC